MCPLKHFFVSSFFVLSSLCVVHFSAEKQQLVRFPLLFQQWYQSLDYVQDIICGGNHSFFLCLCPSAYVILSRTRQTKVISSTCFCSNSFSILSTLFLGGNYTFERYFFFSKPRNREDSLVSSLQKRGLPFIF